MALEENKGYNFVKITQAHLPGVLQATGVLGAFGFSFCSGSDFLLSAGVEFCFGITW